MGRTLPINIPPLRGHLCPIDDSEVTTSKKLARKAKKLFASLIHFRTVELVCLFAKKSAHLCNRWIIVPSSPSFDTVSAVTAK
jgi:hypothetical protein